MAGGCESGLTEPLLETHRSPSCSLACHGQESWLPLEGSGISCLAQIERAGGQNVFPSAEDSLFLHLCLPHSPSHRASYRWTGTPSGYHRSIQNRSLLTFLLVAVCSSRLGHPLSVLPIACSLTPGSGKATVLWILAAGV